MNLTPHFTLEELVESRTAREAKLKAQFAPPENIIANLKALCENILEPLRVQVGAIHVNSGYRSPELNKIIPGSSKTSQHMIGQAADITSPSVTNAQLFEKIKELDLPFDQMIWEFGTKENPAWVHVSYSPRNRRQILFIGVKK